MLKIYPKYKPRSDQQTTQRDRSVTNPMFTEYDQLLHKNKAQFRRYAQISVSLIDLFVKHNAQADNLVLFEKQKFFETVMSAVQAYVDSEQSHISELVQAALNMFLFESKEQFNPFKALKLPKLTLQLTSQTQLHNPMQVIYERQLDLILSTLLDFMHIQAESHTPVLTSIKLVFETLNQQMRLPHNDKLNWLAIKLSKALTVQSV